MLPVVVLFLRLLIQYFKKGPNFLHISKRVPFFASNKSVNCDVINILAEYQALDRFGNLLQLSSGHITINLNVLGIFHSQTEIKLFDPQKPFPGLTNIKMNQILWFQLKINLTSPEKYYGLQQHKNESNSLVSAKKLI